MSLHVQARSRFALERELGQGGEGRVVAVRDAARGGAVVALKETHGASADGLRREFELLATLRHRHLAEVYEFFAQSPLGGARAAYTQVLVPGADLYQTLRQAPALADMLVAQLLTALAQLHAAGLAHLDLKPDNVLVELGDGEPRARLVDFGVAARLGARPTVVRGSRSYLAPEVLAGAPVAASADLFALGIVLAEVALGSATAARKLADSVDRDERRRELERAGLSSPVAALAAVLVARDPAERPPTAAAAARAWGAWRNVSLALVTPASATGLARSGGLVARAREKALLLDACRERRVVTLDGPPASGRTALMESALREAQLRGYAVEAWPLVAATAGVDGFLAALERLVPGAGALGLADGEDAPWAAADASFERAASPERWAASLEAAAARAAEALAALPGEGPAALFVRAPEAAPAPVRAFLRAVGRLARRPLGFVVCAPPDGETDHLAGRERDHITIGAVGAEGVRAFIASRFGPEVAGQGALVSALASASGGLTGRLEALVELLVARGTLALDERGWRVVGDVGALALTSDLAAAIASRVALLAEAEREVLALAALLAPEPGQAVPLGVVAAALDRPLAHVAATADDLAAHGLARLDVLPSALPIGIDAGQAVALGHPSLASALAPRPLSREAKVRVLAREDLADLARARLEGGVGGVRRAIAVAREALAASRPEQADGACTIALALAAAAGGEARESELEALSLRAEIADRLGPREAQIAALRALIAGLPDDDHGAVQPGAGRRSGRRLQAEARLFWALTRVADPGLDARGEALVTRARAAGEARLAAEVGVHLAIVASQRGDQDRAESHLRAAAVDLPETAATLPLRARIANNLGNVHAYRGDHVAALAAYREARRLKVEEGDPVGERIALGNMALMALELGEPARALADVGQSHALARRTGHRRGEAWSLLVLAEIGLEGASPRYAKRRAEAAAALAGALGDQLVEGDARTTLAEALLALDDARAAEREARRGAALAESAENRRTAERAHALAGLARLRDADAAERDAIVAALERASRDAATDATTRLIVARHAAEAALVRGDTATARALVAATAGVRLRGGVRWADLAATRRRVERALGLPDGVPGAVASLASWIEAWPAEPLPDGVDDAALAEGPCRRSVLAHPSVVALLAAPSTIDTAAATAPRARAAEGSRMVKTHDSNALGSTAAGDVAGSGSAARDVANLSLAELERRLAAAVVGIVRALDAERAFLVRVVEGAPGAAATLQLLSARDADGEALPEAAKRLPEAANEAVLRGEPWRAPGPDNRGAIAVVPYLVPLGAGAVRGALVLQNRFVAAAFEDMARAGEAVAGLALLLRLTQLERALEEARAAALAAASSAREVEARTTEEIRSLRRELESTREQLGPVRDYPEIVFASSAMKKMLRQVDRVVATDLPVHVHGESGTGKELVARAIHQLGARARGPFVPQNCTAIPPTLFESELFGHERGAFTGAMRSSEGLFRRAHGGTLFLDEIGDLPLELQAKLLRVLETGEVRPVGATKSVSVDVRIVSATHRDLTDLIKKAAFREDLYYRLNVIRIDVPALRDRPEDIPVLVGHFLARRAAAAADEVRIDEAAMKALVRYAWPGNVRQLENEIARASLLAERGVVTLTDLSPEIGTARGREGGATRAGLDSPTLEGLGLASGHLKDRVDRLEALVLEQALRTADGNKSEVARVLGLSRAGLNLKLKRLGLWEGAD